jgi:integral membrane protein
METTLMNRVYLERLRMVSLIEGVSTLVLFGVAMPLKYLANMPMAVTIVGALHGGLFILLALLFLGAVKSVPISFKLAILGIVAAIFPFGPFIFDRRLRRLDGR